MDIGIYWKIAGSTQGLLSTEEAPGTRQGQVKDEPETRKRHAVGVSPVGIKKNHQRP